MRHQRGPRDGPGGDAAVRRRAAGVRADDRQAASTTTSSCRSRSPRRIFRRSKRRCRRSSQQDEPFERIEVPRDEALADLPANWASSSRSSTSRPGWPTHRDAVVLPPGRVHRPLPRPAHPQHRRDRQGVQAALGRRGVLEGRRHAAAAAAALRHRVLRQGGARRLSARSSKKPSAATIACWASSSNCSPSTRSSARA